MARGPGPPGRTAGRDRRAAWFPGPPPGGDPPFGDHLGHAGARDRGGGPGHPRTRQRGDLGAGGPAKRRAGRFPALVPGERDDAYRALWTWVLAGAPALVATVGRRPGHARRPTAGPHPAPPGTRGAPLVGGGGAGRPPRCPTRSGGDPTPSAGQVRPRAALGGVVGRRLRPRGRRPLRHPGNVLASWLALDLNEQFVRLEDDPAVRDRYLDRWGVAPPGPGRLERMVFSIGVLTTALEEQARSAGWTTRTHEDLCRDPARKFRALFAELGLTWSDATEAFLADNDRAGEGFRTQRVARTPRGLDASPRCRAGGRVASWAGRVPPADLERRRLQPRRRVTGARRLRGAAG